jgi:hypothetical protein
MDCKNRQKNLENCNCTYPCDKKGVCCECIRSHLANNELPACFFSKETEKTYDRSFANFIKENS